MVKQNNMPIVTQTVPVYSQEEQKQIRLNTCKSCVFAKCNGNESNKCNIDSLVCTLDGSFIRAKSSNLANKCAKGYWDNTQATKKIQVQSGCGCGG